jgi:hypothetical protein
MPPEIGANMEVVDAHDQYVGIVESLDGDRIKLVTDSALDPRDPYVARAHVVAVDGNKVRLNQKISAVTTRAFLSPDTTDEVVAKD